MQDSAASATGKPRVKRLGDQLIAAGLLTPEKLSVALAEQKRTGKLLGEILVALKFVTDEDIGKVVARVAGVDFQSISERTIPAKILDLVPKDLVMRRMLIPIDLKDKVLTLAMVDPFDVPTIDRVQELTGFEIDVVTISENEFLQAYEHLYSDEKQRSKHLESVIKEADLSSLVEITSEDDAPVTRLVDQIVEDGITGNATDIHIEPEENVVRVRYRIDGILQSSVSLPKKIQASLESRIKIMSDLNISEKRIPQDGRMTFSLSGRKVDLRVSTMPTVYGENVVLRILDMGKVVVGIDQVGFSSENLSIFKELLEKPFGVILVTGPTGSGKTTTLYSALLHINSLEKNVMTLEDPVEYRLPLIRQSQISPNAGFTFAAGLRALLRQDPDVILVGEMRDTETVDMAIRAALTGHLVLSTLHTNDAASALPRLLDMGVEPYLLPSTIAGIVAQRLVRKVCGHCSEPYEPASEELEAFSLVRSRDHNFLKGAGCDFCGWTGYRGRAAIFEVLTMNREIVEHIRNRESGAVINEAAKAYGMVSIREEGARKAAQGMTTLNEVRRITERRLSVARRKVKSVAAPSNAHKDVESCRNTNTGQ